MKKKAMKGKDKILSIGQKKKKYQNKQSVSNSSSPDDYYLLTDMSPLKDVPNGTGRPNILYQWLTLKFKISKIPNKWVTVQIIVH